MTNSLFPCTIFLVLLSIFSLFSFQVNSQGATVGGKRTINNVATNKQMQDLGKSCVDEYNRVEDEKNVNGAEDLIFVRVVDAAAEKVSPGSSKYHLKMDVTDQLKKSHMFKVVVMVNQTAAGDDDTQFMSYLLAPDYQNDQK